MKQVITCWFLLLGVLTAPIASAQQGSAWSLQFGVALASENNLGDHGLRTFAALRYDLGSRWQLGLAMNSFQMLGVNEKTEAPFDFNRRRSLSFFHWDLLAGFRVVDAPNVRLALNLGPSYRIGRQLWAEFSGYSGGNFTHVYTFEKLNELGIGGLLDVSVRLKDRWWAGLNVNSHQYNFFGEYLGAGLGTTVQF